MYSYFSAQENWDPKFTFNIKRSCKTVKKKIKEVLKQHLNTEIKPTDKLK